MCCNINRELNDIVNLSIKIKLTILPVHIDYKCGSFYVWVGIIECRRTEKPTKHHTYYEIKKTKFLWNLRRQQ